MSTYLPDLPDPIGLGYRTWRFKYDEGCQDSEYGEILYTKGMILIAPDQDGPCLADTVIHELLHAILHNVDTPLTTKHQETTVTQLAHGLVELIQRNPHLLRWLQERLQEERA